MEKEIIMKITNIWLWNFDFFFFKFSLNLNRVFEFFNKTIQLEEQTTNNILLV